MVKYARDAFGAIEAEFDWGMAVCRGCLVIAEPAVMVGDESPLCPECAKDALNDLDAGGEA